MTACDQARELQCIIDQQLISTMFHPIVTARKELFLAMIYSPGLLLPKAFAKARLITLKKRDFRVAIDDLGTGYSGLKL
jgi:predicted signal transduction protein with EAL and GGDEF domain